MNAGQIFTLLALSVLIASCGSSGRAAVIETVNAPPQANAGVDQSVMTGSLVVLDCTGSWDPDGDPLTIAWTQTGGTTVQLSDTAVPQPTLTAPDQAGPLDFEVMVSDGTDQSTDAVQVTVNQPPPPPPPPTPDPSLGFSTLLGGSSWERVQSVFVDASGFIYVGGTTKSSNFPTTSGAYDTTGSGSGQNDGFVAKLSADGSQLIWSTYLHGNQRDDVYGVRADSSGVYVTGWTRSATTFPTTAGAYDRTHNGGPSSHPMDIFVTKLSPDGSSLIYSTFIGGSGIDQARGGMFVSASGEVYLSGYTDSTDFPVTSNAYQRTFAGGYGDALALKLSANGSSLVFATYLGGTGADNAFAGISVLSDGSFVIGGNAGNSTFPTTQGAAQTTFGGSGSATIWTGDAFVARLSSNASSLIYSTFVGGSGDEVTGAQNALVTDSSGNAYLIGSTPSADFPTTTGAFQTGQKGNSDLFVTKVAANGSSFLASTYLGGYNDVGAASHEASGLAVHPSSGAVYVSGTTAVTDFPVTSDAIQSVHAGGVDDAFLTVLASDLKSLVYSSYFGGTGSSIPKTDRGRALWLTADGSAVVVGDTDSPDFPTTSGAYQETYVGGADGYVFLTKLP